MIGYKEERMDTPSISPRELTKLLAHWSHGDDVALEEILPGTCGDRPETEADFANKSAGFLRRSNAS